MIPIHDLPQLAKNKEKENKQFFAKLRKKKPKKLDDVMHRLHDEAFEHIDCLACANCCRTLGPRLSMKDIERLSKYLKLSDKQFISQYLCIDEDKDYVFAEMPCPFLDDENYCLVYQHRPKACREYPHTDSKRFVQLLGITRKNIAVCPAVYEIIEKLKQSPDL